MITCEFRKEKGNGVCRGFSLFGHAGAAVSGQDIVCAAVSSAAYLTANAVTDVLKVSAKVTERKSPALLEVCVTTEQAPECRPFFTALRLHLQNLAEQYPQYICICEKEV